jgi:hypothetical protein
MRNAVNDSVRVETGCSINDTLPEPLRNSAGFVTHAKEPNRANRDTARMMMTYHDDVRLHLFTTHCINHFERRGPASILLHEE